VYTGQTATSEVVLLAEIMLTLPHVVHRIESTVIIIKLLTHINRTECTYDACVTRVEGANHRWITGVVEEAESGIDARANLQCTAAVWGRRVIG